LFAFPEILRDQQRDIIVVEEHNPESCRYYRFKSNWLQVANYDQVAFKVGDRVQLNISVWLPDNEVTAGKCLGKDMLLYFM